MLEIRNVSKIYHSPAGPLHILSEVNLSLKAGSSISVIGPSGSGKSTLLYILGALEAPTSGTVLLDGVNPFELDEEKMAAFRNAQVGFVFQDHHLLPQCTVLENVLLPTLVAPKDATSPQDRAVALLEQVGLRSRLHHLPSELSGGEKQRVALARALIRDPRLILCDEPTGNLDHAATEAVAALLIEMHRIRQNILIVVTHNLELAARFDQRFKLGDARLERL